MTTWNEFSWAVGILEGEGAFWTIKRKCRDALAVQIKVSITDEDVARRLHRAIGYGKVYGPYSEVKRPHCKPYWEFRVVKYAEVYALIDKLLPHMCARRKEQLKKQRVALDMPGRRWKNQ